MGESGFWERVYHRLDLDAEPAPRAALVELIGGRRVLIENHCGVSEYGDNQMRIRVKLGEIVVCGNKLRLVQMTRERLIICGCIETIQVLRGKK